MPNNKKHHYVPKFYLKRFSVTESRSINIFNIPSRRSILDGNLGNQCYSNRYYGPTPVVENALSRIEGEAARVIAEIESSRQLPESNTADHFILISFVVFQAARTKASGEAADEMADKA